MTFYEAALRILESEGRPLHFLEITEKSIAQNLLSHVGKTPEQTMLSRLAAMARRTRERKVVVTAKDTFALVEWSLPEDAEALAQTGVVEPNPEESMPPMRPEERHPEPRNENARSAGRGSERKRRRDEEEEGRGGKRRRFPPLPEVAFEVLSEADEPLRAEELLERARSRELAAEDLAVEALLTALLEDNQRRIDAGRRPQFSFSGETRQLALERGGGAEGANAQELQAAFAAALGIPLEAGRPVLGKPAPAAAAAEAATDPALALAARTALKDARRAVARALRRRLAELEVGTFEKSVVKMMHALGFRELKVAKRSKEGPLLTARKREGSVELRYAVRMVKGAPAIDRKAVQELRRDLSHYSAQVGLLACAGDVRGDAKSEAQASGALVMLWCGDALGEKFLEAETAVTVTRVELFDIDERFFDAAKVEAEEAQKRREERQKERQAREDGGAEAPPRREAAEREEDEEVSAAAPSARPERAPRPAPAPAAEAAAPAAAGSGSDEEEGEEGDEEGDDEQEGAGGARAEGAEGAPGERKRRRRRRRGRRGRGNRPEGTAEAGAAPASDAAAATPPGEAGAAPAPEAAAAAPTEPAAPEAPAPAEGGAPPQDAAASVTEVPAPPAAAGDELAPAQAAAPGEGEEARPVPGVPPPAAPEGGGEDR
ncbi:hypothetical protein FGE12_17085 [Aggregicoccus sp. 17bor-14]|uniref:HTH domain-containing protein n=1 Tax=Myxococcaceae TaxID=31 RepID=UPI00129CF230|nr:MULTISPECIES: HTH domain-containing protein [Myxococcaceae]MBF5044116.1 restriction endonuclease [Simulacricoccus sp. 17bor-14]MRI89866.1 hypothetical protein [Aggregicoccus sp. 17bor-14]